MTSQLSTNLLQGMLTAGFIFSVSWAGDCAMFNYCNGHGCVVIIHFYKLIIFVISVLINSMFLLWNMCPFMCSRCETSTSSCACYEGWGASTDITLYRAPDCSRRTCPSGKAWADVPAADMTAHQPAECSNRGICNRVTGQCSCFDGFTGDACNRNKCPNDCSGHGQCFSMKQLAKLSNALPLSPNSYYEGEEVCDSFISIFTVVSCATSNSFLYS